MTPLSACVASALLALGAVGCSSDAPEAPAVSPPTAPLVATVDPAPCEGSRIGPTPSRLLTAAEYNSTVRDLLGDATHPADAFSSAGKVYGFDNNAYAASVSQIQAESYQLAAETIAANAVLVPGFIPCNPRSIGEDACLAMFLDIFAKRAYRRPLLTSERQVLEGVYAAVREDPELTFYSGVLAVVETILQSPQFLYRVDQGIENSTDDPNLLALTPYEVASRLSYFLWATMPDADLFAAADAGELTTAAQIEAQARRMVQDPKAIEGFRNFYRQWLGLDTLDHLTKDPAAFPEFSEDLAGYMKEETSRFMDHVVWELDGGVEMLLSASYTFVNGPLARMYGVSPEPPDEATWVQVDLDPARRVGLLSHASWLASAAHADQTSPVRRGLFIRRKLLCQELPPPPPNVDITLPALDPNLTTRERFTKHATDPYCASCHSMMDPIGLALENYDPIGVWRDTENGMPIDNSGTLYDAGEETGDFVGPRELGERLSQSEAVRSCVALQLFRYASGRGEDALDACTVDDLQREFIKNNSIRELLVQMTLTEAFRRRVAVSSHLTGEPKGI